MKHIRSYNLATHEIFCDVLLAHDDLRLIRECVKLIDYPDERVHIVLTDNRKASVGLMPDTTIPIVKAVCPNL